MCQVQMAGGIENLNSDDPIACPQIQHHIFGDTSVDEFLFLLVESKV